MPSTRLQHVHVDVHCIYMYAIAKVLSSPVASSLHSSSLSTHHLFSPLVVSLHSSSLFTRHLSPLVASSLHSLSLSTCCLFFPLTVSAALVGAEPRELLSSAEYELASQRLNTFEYIKHQRVSLKFLTRKPCNFALAHVTLHLVCTVHVHVHVHVHACVCVIIIAH